jgi:hypothetical protein
MVASLGVQGGGAALVPNHPARDRCCNANTVAATNCSSAAPTDEIILGFYIFYSSPLAFAFSKRRPELRKPRPVKIAYQSGIREVLRRLSCALRHAL